MKPRENNLLMEIPAVLEKNFYINLVLSSLFTEAVQNLLLSLCISFFFTLSPHKTCKLHNKYTDIF